jgi:spore germination cell wall hydrolase CwlJ-like protein
MNKFIYLILLVAGISTAYVLNDLMSNPVESDLFSPENVERVRQNIPKEYKPVIQEPVRKVVDAQALECLQKNLYFESRNQGYWGQVATGWVTINRVNSKYYPDSVCEVVYQGVHRNGVPVRNKCKFSWYCDGRSDTPREQRAWEIAGEIAYQMLDACVVNLDRESCPEDITNGALYYHTKQVEPSWSKVYTVSASVGSHIFYTRN